MFEVNDRVRVSDNATYGSVQQDRPSCYAGMAGIVIEHKPEMNFPYSVRFDNGAYSFFTATELEAA
jgi:hypothetical protein